MPVESGLRRLVVIWGNTHNSVHPYSLGLLGELYGVCRGVVSGSGNDNCPVSDRLVHDLEKLELLLMSQGRRLSGGSCDDDSVRTILNKPDDQLFNLCVVHFQVRPKRCNHGRKNPCNLTILSHIGLTLQICTSYLSSKLKLRMQRPGSPLHVLDRHQTRD